MSYRRFFAISNYQRFFGFKIDTNKIVIGATEGSQLNTQFIMPFNVNTKVIGSAIMRVSDGRADVVLTNANIDAYKTLALTPGIFEIKIFGVLSNIGFIASPDVLKIIELHSFGTMSFSTNAFLNASNLIVKATDHPALLGNQTQIFRSIKGFDSVVDLTTWDFSKVTSAAYMFYQVSNSMISIPQGFINMVNMDRLYQAAPISTIPKIEIISTTVTAAQWLFYQTNYRGRIVFKTPNLTDISNFLWGISNPPSLGEVDIRSVTTATNFITLAMSIANVDATLLGWQSNFDWSVITSVTTSYDFKNSKYSNNASVITAKTFLESKGITFTNLTMA